LTADALWIRLPRLASWHHQLSVIWRLREIWSTMPSHTERVVLDVEALEGLPVALENVLLALEHGLRCRGCELQIVGGRSAHTRNLSEEPVSGPGGAPQPLAAGAQQRAPGSGSEESGCDPARTETGCEEMTMSETSYLDNFEQRLLEYVDTLYRVALKLTRDPQDAERITRTAMLQAWHSRNSLGAGRHLKAELLRLLRETFIREGTGCPAGVPSPELAAAL
jgi:hypothetical protein